MAWSKHDNACLGKALPCRSFIGLAFYATEIQQRKSKGNRGRGRWRPRWSGRGRRLAAPTSTPPPRSLVPTEVAGDQGGRVEVADWRP
ncbi:hypothetical protein CRG98_030847 [Punica granatum]|uniref:Uncharacterized protein n=1 Tax=Punica granatum TaxID=22663 RepID=A0A2I0IXV9_PUNGR|nr:hypothetical protein CRG98_030847 [Punica granatum]